MGASQFLGLGFLVVRPFRGRGDGQKVLDLLVSQGGIYEPEECEIWNGGEKYVKKRFSQSLTDLLLDQWAGLFGPFKGFNLLRFRPYRTQFIAQLNDYVDFDSFSFYVEGSYLREESNSLELLDFGKKLYGTLSPPFGDIDSACMTRTMKKGKLEFYPGTNLAKQGLPDLKWGAFLGPEYVEMLGREKVLTTPCYRIEQLPDGGVLLILSGSPFDFESDTKSFNEKKDAVRAHLGEDAFHRGDDISASRFPRFRFWDERQRLIQESWDSWKKKGQSSASPTTFNSVDRVFNKN